MQNEKHQIFAIPYFIWPRSQNVVIADCAADARREGRRCSNLLQAICNTADAVQAPIPRGLKNENVLFDINTNSLSF
ncbi:MAG: hypothetical protein Q7J98_03920 [Kiritimatiellia bacterium]|nr:hypothetical protein [Kiritimatiellia bacterium]